MDTIKDLLKGSNPIVILLLIFLIWQVTNHIPTQIKDLKSELNGDIHRLEDRISSLESKVDSKISRLEDKISSLENKIDQVLIHLVKESK